ncbi:hypothetical protein OGATHE_006659 [Ogataea polymorpha]|uniref:Uncharacterized protein n=1 Tax=Ogataea polymorpha TaxID=460523 RepID=A0A9P8NRZ1_9ASCO|nr:hypothetical protein OGATHE_006659 [Ogataea polymorpha]
MAIQRSSLETPQKGLNKDELNEVDDEAVENAKIGMENKLFLSPTPADISSKADAPNMHVIPPSNTLFDKGIEPSELVFGEEFEYCEGEEL